MPLRAFIEPWLAGLENQGRKPTTLRGYRLVLVMHVPPRLGDVALQELRASDLDALYASLLRSGGRDGTGLSLTSVHHVHAGSTSCSTMPSARVWSRGTWPGWRVLRR
jgi:hypothetical protein